MEIVSLSVGKYKNRYPEDKSNMRGILIFLFAAAVLSCPLAGSAQRRGGNVMQISPENIKVSLNLVASPRIGYDKQGGEQRVEYKWLQVRVTYMFDNQYRAGFTFDNLRCDVFLHTVASPVAWLKNYWFTGSQKFYSVIPGKKGTVHQALFFMPPPLLYKATGGKKYSANIMKDCIVFVRIYNGERLLGRLIWSGRAKGGKVDAKLESAAIRAFNRMNNDPVNKIANGLWPQANTPWQWLGADRAELPVPAFEMKTSAPAAKQDSAEAVEDTEENEGNNNSKGSVEVDEAPGNVEFTRSSGKKNRNKKRNR